MDEISRANMSSSAGGVQLKRQDHQIPDRTRRFIEGTAAVAIWMIMGFAFHLSGNAFLLLGVPITVILQRIVRRAPLRSMWVREAPPFYLGKTGAGLVVLLMIRPAMDLLKCIRLHVT